MTLLLFSFTVVTAIFPELTLVIRTTTPKSASLEGPMDCESNDHTCMDRTEQDKLVTLAAQPYTFSFSAFCLFLSFKYIYNHQLTPLFINLYSHSGLRCNSSCVQLAYDTTSFHPSASVVVCYGRYHPFTFPSSYLLLLPPFLEI